MGCNENEQKEQGDGGGDTEQRLLERARTTGAGRGCRSGNGMGAAGQRTLCLLVQSGWTVDVSGGLEGDLSVQKIGVK